MLTSSSSSLSSSSTTTTYASSNTNNPDKPITIDEDIKKFLHLHNHIYYIQK